MRIGIVLHPKKKTIAKFLPQIIDYLLENNHQLIMSDDIEHDFIINHSSIKLLKSTEIKNNIDLMFSIGGDGTFLGGARLIADTNIPILGIHLGDLGFLAEITIDNYKERLTSFFNGNYLIEDRSVLEGIVNFKNNEEKYYAFNELLISRGNIMGMTKIRTFIDGEYLNTYRGDGVIVATPSGSTAYNLSAGGPIINPDLNVFVISPVCPHSLSARPVIISDKQVVSFDCNSIPQKVALVIDGHNRISLKKATKLTIKKAGFYLRIIRFKEDTFFKTLQTKLHWGIDKRGK